MILLQPEDVHDGLQWSVHLSHKGLAHNVSGKKLICITEHQYSKHLCHSNGLTIEMCPLISTVNFIEGKNVRR